MTTTFGKFAAHVGMKSHKFDGSKMIINSDKGYWSIFLNGINQVTDATKLHYEKPNGKGCWKLQFVG